MFHKYSCYYCCLY